MKKMLIFVFMFFLLSPMTVSASEDSSADGIMIVPMDGYQYYDSFDNPFEGHIDILIYKDDYEDIDIYSEINQNFKDLYENTDSIEHLSNTDWVSYLAYYRNASVMVMDHGVMYLFADTIKEQYYSIDRIKIVYFDEDGHTIFTTDEVEIIHPNAIQSRHGEITLRIDNQEVSNTYRLGLDIKYLPVFLLLMYIVLPALVIYCLFLLIKLIRRKFIHHS